MNLENQLQVAFATIAELREQIDTLSRVNWSLEERLLSDAENLEVIMTDGYNAYNFLDGQLSIDICIVWPMLVQSSSEPTNWVVT